MEDYIAVLDELHGGGGCEHNELWDQMLKYFPKRKAGDEEVRLPSWIPRLSSAPFEMYHQAGVPIQKLGRKNADPLVAPPGQSINYDAAQSTALDEKALRFKKRRAQVSMRAYLFSMISIQLLSLETITIPLLCYKVYFISLSRYTIADLII